MPKNKIGIELAGPNNDRVFFNPLQEAFRGRYDSAKVAGLPVGSAVGELIRKSPYIPGMYLILDLKEAKLAIVDPLESTDEGRKIWAEIKPILDQNRAALGGPFATIAKRIIDIEEQHQQDMEKDDVIKSYAWNMRQLVDSGLARMLSECDPLPTAKEIDEEWPGRRWRDFGAGKYTGLTPEQTEAMRFVVPKGAKTKPAPVTT